MGAATEYYGYLLSQGYGKTQLKEFAEIAGRADRGEISHNQAYKQACKAGFGKSDDDSWEYLTDEDESKKNIGDWFTMAQEAGWIDAGIGMIGGLIQKNKDKKSGGGGLTAEQLRAQAEELRRLEDERGLSTGAKIGIGVGALAVVGVVVFLIIRKK